MTLFQLSYIALWILAILLLPLTAVLLYQNSYVLAAWQYFQGRKEVALRLGSEMPQLKGSDLSSGAARSTIEWYGKAHILLALSPGCASCKSLTSELVSMSNRDLLDARVVVVCVGDGDLCREAFSSRLAISVLTVSGKQTTQLLATGLPAAIAIDDAGIVKELRHPYSMTEVIGMLRSNEDGNELQMIGQNECRRSAAGS